MADTVLPAWFKGHTIKAVPAQVSRLETVTSSTSPEANTRAYQVFKLINKRLTDVWDRQERYLWVGSEIGTGILRLGTTSKPTTAEELISSNQLRTVDLTEAFVYPQPFYGAHRTKRILGTLFNSVVAPNPGQQLCVPANEATVSNEEEQDLFIAENVTYTSAVAVATHVSAWMDTERPYHHCTYEACVGNSETPCSIGGCLKADWSAQIAEWWRNEGHRNTCSWNSFFTTLNAPRLELSESQSSHVGTPDDASTPAMSESILSIPMTASESVDLSSAEGVHCKVRGTITSTSQSATCETMAEKLDISAGKSENTATATPSSDTSVGLDDTDGDGVRLSRLGKVRDVLRNINDRVAMLADKVSRFSVSSSDPEPHVAAKSTLMQDPAHAPQLTQVVGLFEHEKSVCGSDATTESPPLPSTSRFVFSGHKTRNDSETNLVINLRYTRKAVRLSGTTSSAAGTETSTG